MDVTLTIDTSQVNSAIVGIVRDGNRIELRSESRIRKSQMVLPLIEDILSRNQLKLTDVTAITVITGPGSFTGLRVGATVANALGYLLDIPVNGKKAIVLPVY